MSHDVITTYALAIAQHQALQRAAQALLLDLAGQTQLPHTTLQRAAELTAALQPTQEARHG